MKHYVKTILISKQSEHMDVLSMEKHTRLSFDLKVPSIREVFETLL